MVEEFENLGVNMEFNNKQVWELTQQMTFSRRLDQKWICMLCL